MLCVQPGCGLSRDDCVTLQVRLLNRRITFLVSHSALCYAFSSTVAAIEQHILLLVVFLRAWLVLGTAESGSGVQREQNICLVKQHEQEQAQALYALFEVSRRRCAFLQRHFRKSACVAEASAAICVLSQCIRQALSMIVLQWKRRLAKEQGNRHRLEQLHSVEMSRLEDANQVRPC